MKKIVCLMLAAAMPVLAVDKLLIWDANPPEQEVTGYNVYELIGANWTKIGSSPTNGFRLVNIAPGRHTYTVTATNMWGESPQAVPVSTPPVPQKPENLRLDK